MIEGVAQYASVGANVVDGDAKGRDQDLRDDLTVAVLPVRLGTEDSGEAVVGIWPAAG